MLGGHSAAARLYLFGRFRLLVEGERDVAPKSAKARAMLAHLALSREGRASRASLAGLLWSESADPKTSLRQAVRDVRATLGSTSGFFIAGAQEVSLDLDGIWVDARRAQQLARSIRAPDIDELIELATGDLLEDVDVRDPAFEEWLLVERTRVREQIVRALRAALDASLQARDLARAEQVARAILGLEPAHEAAHCALMRCHAVRGDMAAVMRQFHACKGLLASHLDLAPAPETQTLLAGLQKDAAASPGAQARILGPILARQGPQHPALTIMERPQPAGDNVDASVGSALAAALREAMTRKRWLAVLDPAGLATPRPAADADQPHYVVTTAYRRGADRVRFWAELKEASSSRVLWAEHFDRGLEEQLFDLIDDLAAVLAQRLDGEIELAEITRAAQTPIEFLSAYDCLLRAIPLIFKLTPQSFAEADRFLRQAEGADRQSSMVYAWRCFWYFLTIGQGWAEDLQTARQELAYLVRRAIELDPANALALSVAGHIAAFIQGDYARALDLFGQSLRLDPNSPYGADLSALTLCYTGNAEEGLRRLQSARGLWEQHQSPGYFRTTACIALSLAGQHEQAVEVGRRTIRENPNFQATYRPLLASLGHLGRVEEAQEHLAGLKRLQPSFSIDWFRANYPRLERDYSVRYIEGLRRAGVPES